MKLVLASQSPRRIELMRPIAARLTGGLFDVRPSGFDEAAVSEPDPRRLVERLAFEKASAVPAAPGEWIIGCDTVVALEGIVFGKPAGRAAAIETLTALSGRTHSVLTGVCVLAGGPEPQRLVCETRVTFFPLSPAEIECYCDSGEPYDKAGGYGIQGGAALFAEKIEGDYCNVVGLPAAPLYRLLRRLMKNLPANKL